MAYFNWKNVQISLKIQIKITLIHKLKIDLLKIYIKNKILHNRIF